MALSVFSLLYPSNLAKDYSGLHIVYFILLLFQFKPFMNCPQNKSLPVLFLIIILI